MIVFEIGYHALKRISDRIKVGGAGFALGYDRYQYHQLIQNWEKTEGETGFYQYVFLLLSADPAGQYVFREAIPG